MHAFHVTFGGHTRWFWALKTTICMNRSVQDIRLSMRPKQLLSRYGTLFMSPLVICQYLSALTITGGIVANELLLNVYTFQNKWQRCYFLHCFPCCAENKPNRDPKTDVHTEPWVLCPVIITFAPLLPTEKSHNYCRFWPFAEKTDGGQCEIFMLLWRFWWTSEDSCSITSKLYQLKTRHLCT